MNTVMQSEPKDISTATSWYANALNYCLNLGQGIQGLFSFLKFSRWVHLLKWASPIALGASWLTTFAAFKNLYEAENRNYERYLDVALSFGSSLAWTIIYAGGVAVAGSILALTSYVAVHVLPAIAVGVFAYNAAYGVFNIFKNLYYAYKADDKQVRKNYLWQAAKQIPNIFVNTMAGIASFLLGIKMTELTSKLTWNYFTNIPIYKKIAAVALRARPYIYAVAAVFTLRATASVGKSRMAAYVAKKNQETWQAFQNPVETLKNSWQKIKENPLQIIIQPVKALVRTASLLVVGPLQLIGKGLSVLWNIISSSTNEEVVKQEKPQSITVDSQDQENEQKKDIVRDAERLTALKSTVTKIQGHLKNLENQNASSPSEERQAKIKLLAVVLNKKFGVTKDSNLNNYQLDSYRKEVSLKFIELSAKEKCRTVYSSFFKKVGRVKELVNEVYAIDKEFNHSSPSARAA